MLVDLRQADLERATRRAAAAAPMSTSSPPTSATPPPPGPTSQRTVERFGKIDVLFSNAGNQGPVTPVTDYPEDRFDALIAVHVRGAFLACKYGAAADERRRQHHHHLERGGRHGRARLGRLRDRQARPGRPDAHGRQGGGARAASGSTRCIRVRSTTPFRRGSRRTSARWRAASTPPRCSTMRSRCTATRSPDEIARSALYLASDLSSFVTGSVLMADGGMRG